MACSRHDSKEKKLFFFTSSSLYSTKKKLAFKTSSFHSRRYTHGSQLSVYLLEGFFFFKKKKQKFIFVGISLVSCLFKPHISLLKLFVCSCFTCWHGNLLSLLAAASCIRGPENDYNTVRFVISWERKSFIESRKKWEI